MLFELILLLEYCECSKEVLPVHGLSETIVGVLGGGQLGRMLCQAASKMAIKVMVLDPQENCPASKLAYHHMVGRFDDSATVQEFAKRFDFYGLGCILCAYVQNLHSHNVKHPFVCVIEDKTFVPNPVFGS